MKMEDYNEYYIQGSDHYLIPNDEFEELFNEMINWKEESKKQKEMIYKAIKELSEFRRYHFIEEDTEYRELNHILETLGVEFEEYI